MKDSMFKLFRKKHALLFLMIPLLGTTFNCNGWWTDILVAAFRTAPYGPRSAPRPTFNLNDRATDATVGALRFAPHLIYIAPPLMAAGFRWYLNSLKRDIRLVGSKVDDLAGQENGNKKS